MVFWTCSMRRRSSSCRSSTFFFFRHLLAARRFFSRPMSVDVTEDERRLTFVDDFSTACAWLATGAEPLHTISGSKYSGVAPDVVVEGCW